MISRSKTCSLWVVKSLLLACTLALAACSQSPGPRHPPTLAVQTSPVIPNTPTSTNIPTISTAAAAARPTVTPWPTGRLPTYTLTPSQTPTPIPIPIWAPEANLLRNGNPLPQDLAVITRENASYLTEIARWGSGAIIQLAYAPDGHRVAVATGQGVYIYETRQYTLLRFIPITLVTEPLSFSPSLHYLAQGYDDSIEVWDLETGQRPRQFHTGEYNSSIQSITFTPDERQVYAGSIYVGEGVHGHTYVWDFQDGQLLQKRDHGSQAMALSADGHVFAAWLGFSSDTGDAEDARKVAVWKGDAAEPWQIIVSDEPESNANQPKFIKDFALSPDGKLLAVVTGQGNQESVVQIWRLATGELWQKIQLQTPDLQPIVTPPPGKYQFPMDNYHISDLVFSPDSQVLAVRNEFGWLHQWRLQDGVLLRVDNTIAGQLAYSPDGKILVAFGGPAEFRQSNSGKLLHTLEDHAGSVRDMKFAPDGRSLAVGSSDGNVRLRRTQDGTLVHTLETFPQVPANPYSLNNITSLDYAQDGSLIAAGTAQGAIYLWPSRGGAPRILTPQCSDIRLITEHISLSSDHQYLALGGFPDWHEIIRLSDASSRCLQGAWRMQFAFSPAASLLTWNEYTGKKPWYESDSREMKLLNMPGLETQKTLGTGAWGLAPPTFSKDGSRLAIHAATISVWDVETASRIADFPDAGHLHRQGEVTGLAITPDNRLLVILWSDGLMVYDIDSTALSYNVYLPTDGWAHLLRSLALSPDGRLLAVSGTDGIVHLLGVVP